MWLLFGGKEAGMLQWFGVGAAQVEETDVEVEGKASSGYVLCWVVVIFSGFAVVVEYAKVQV